MTDAELDALRAERDDLSMESKRNWDIALTAKERAEKAEAENAVLRQLLLRWLQIINRAKKEAATVAEWDKLRQDSDAAMKEKP